MILGQPLNILKRLGVPLTLSRFVSHDFISINQITGNNRLTIRPLNIWFDSHRDCFRTVILLESRSTLIVKLKGTVGAKQRLSCRCHVIIIVLISVQLFVKDPLKWRVIDDSHIDITAFDCLCSVIIRNWELHTLISCT